MAPPVSGTYFKDANKSHDTVHPNNSKSVRRCGNTLTTWYPEDQAMFSHARIVPNCPYVLRSTSRYYVRDIIQRESPSQQRDILLADWRTIIGIVLVQRVSIGDLIRV